MKHRSQIVTLKLQRRDAVRYKLRLPVIFHWKEDCERTEGGFTCDVALDGALIRSPRCPPIGTDVQIEVLLPTPDRSGDDVKIDCIGMVIRISNQGGLTCFGVQGNFDDDHITNQVDCYPRGCTEL